MGRPPKYTLEELQEKVESFFNTHDVPTKAGLRLTLGVSRETISNWTEKGHEFIDTLKEANDKIEKYWLERLDKPACTGAIFYLKNAFKEDYKDRYEQDLTSKGERMVPIYAGKSLPGHESNTEDIQSKE